MKSDIIIQLHKNFEDYAHQIDGEEFCLPVTYRGFSNIPSGRTLSRSLIKPR